MAHQIVHQVRHQVPAVAVRYSRRRLRPVPWHHEVRFPAGAGAGRGSGEYPGWLSAQWHSIRS